MFPIRLFVGTSLLLGASLVTAHTGHELVDEIVVSGRGLNLVGAATAASEGVIGQEELALRPMLRAG